MGFFNPRKVEKSYDILGSFSWYVPGFAGIFSILGWFLVGMLVSMVIAVPMTLSGMQMCYVMLVIYPLQFMPVFIYSRIRSSRNATFERGYRLDSNHFGKKGGAALAVLAGVGMLAASLMLEVVNNFLPEMSEQLKTTMEMMTGGPLVPSLVCVGVFAPLFEEWMCRGLVLRGLLNYGKGRDGSSRNGKGVSPALAIGWGRLMPGSESSSPPCSSPPSTAISGKGFRHFSSDAFSAMSTTAPAPSSLRC